MSVGPEAYTGRTMAAAASDLVADFLAQSKGNAGLPHPVTALGNHREVRVGRKLLPLGIEPVEEGSKGTGKVGQVLPLKLDCNGQCDTFLFL